MGCHLRPFLATYTSATPPAGTIVDGGLAGSLGNAVFPFSALIIHGARNETAPKAYLNWIVCDRDFNPIIGESGFIQISTLAKENGTNVSHELLKRATPLKIKEPGYVYIYLSNENETSVEVFFDDFRVEQVKGPVVQMDDYYPFGLAFNSYQRENSTPNQYLYNGKELQDELGLGLFDFDARMYDPTVGRTTTQDPHSENYFGLSPYSWTANNPIIFIDPTGMDFMIAKYKDLSDEDREKYSRKEYRQMRREGKDAIKNGEAKSSTFAAMVNDLENSDNTHTVSFTKTGQSKSDTDGNGDSQIVININETTEGLENSDQLTNTTVITAHEVGHSWRAEQGLDPEKQSVEDVKTLADLYSFIKKSDQRKSVTESGAVTIENMVRSELNVPLRERYNDGKGGAFYDITNDKYNYRQRHNIHKHHRVSPIKKK